MARSVHPHPDSEFGTPIKYDPDFNGPLGRRSCTDILCLLLFIVFIICWIGIGIFAIKQGDADLMLVPRDTQGRRCGHDAQVLDKPYLFFIDIMKCVGPDVIFTGCKTPQVCLKKCPENTYTYNENEVDIIKDIICAGDRPKDKNDLKQKMKNGECAKWYIPTVSIFKRCVFVDFPAKYVGLDADETRVLKNRVAVGLSWLSLYVQNAISHFTDNKNIQQIFGLIAEDLIQSWWKILLGFAAAIVFCLIYIILMRWIAAVMVWFSIVGVIALLAFGCYQSAVKYKYLQENPPQSNNANSGLIPVENLTKQKNLWLGLLIVSAVLLAVCLLVLIFLRKRIMIAIALIREGSKAVSSITSTLFFPVVPWLLQILLVAYTITVGLYLTSVGVPEYQVKGSSDKCECPGYKNNDSCVPSEFVFKCSTILQDASCSDLTCSLSEIQKAVHVKIFHAVNIIGMLWSLFFVSALGEMILAATFATWYWTFRKSDVPFFTLTTSVLRTFRYHLGTLAFGSLIITICRLIRIMIEYIDHKLRKYDNAFVNGIVCCCKCFFWCLEKFLKFINKNAYIMCAIHGRNFCLSAKDAFNLLMRNILRVFVVDKVTDMLFFLGKLVVTAIVSLVAYTAFTNADFNMIDTKELHYVLVPVISIAIGTYLISSVFFGVYSMAVDTLFLCFLEDCERNDGSAEKPYFMSKELMRILGKKNKMS